MTDKPVTITARPDVPFIDVVREFDAPVASVYRAYTDPELVVRWLGPRELTMKLTEFDVREGGSWSYTHYDPEGNGYDFRGVFHSVVPDERLVQTFEFGGAPGHVSLDSATFEDIGGNRTRLVTHSVFQSVEDRDAMVAGDMERGVTDSMNRLAEVLAGTAKAG
ncbi:SRPBCC family protein [Nocardiopsis ansamitocini]|uniref:ATPase n=1 Tax=Nocardiopsis ansamitocini TaxID=1670832 RepID=A0A9W6PAP2_9ACTN|nr:SRPBCC family protein [Nocardiopsis ansamitocini]GLU50109.1 ATPase [Nocardiopsis ansamitocini]